jgi:hypothetical protein
MPSPAERRARRRVALERALRAVAVASLGVALWRWTRPAPAAAAAVPEVAEGGAIGDALARWTRAPAAAGHASLDALPDPVTRDWLRALAGAGMRVGWSAARAPSLAVSGERAREPGGDVLVRVASPPGLAVAVGDEAGTLDSVRAGRAGAGVALGAAGDTLVARAGGAVARAAGAPAPRLGQVLVLARAGWEGKFVVAALEERGWAVRARLAVAPGVVVEQGAAAVALDTATTAAVVALDSASLATSGTGRLAAYVRAGGGLVLAGNAARAAGALAVARGGDSVPGVPGALVGEAPRRGLALRPLAGLADGAVVLERRPSPSGIPATGAPVAAAARRVGAGRVVQLGYADTWRWRLAGDDGAPEAHRRWWSGVVGAAAYAPAAAPADTAGATGGDALDPAPLASAVAALGPPSPAPARAAAGGPARSHVPDAALLATALAAVLAEVASRRSIRGLVQVDQRRDFLRTAGGASALLRFDAASHCQHRHEYIGRISIGDRHLDDRRLTFQLHSEARQHTLARDRNQRSCFSERHANLEARGVARRVFLFLGQHVHTIALRAGEPPVVLARYPERCRCASDALLGVGCFSSHQYLAADARRHIAQDQPLFVGDTGAGGG